MFSLLTVEDRFTYDKMALESLHVLIFCPSNIGSVDGYAFMALCLIEQRENFIFFFLYIILGSIKVIKVKTYHRHRVMSKSCPITYPYRSLGLLEIGAW